MTSDLQTDLRRRGLLLEYLTIGWNVVEAVIAIAAGLAASSIALVSFGFDSSIEVAAAAVVVWQFRAEIRGGVDEQRERKALKMIAFTFFLLAAYVTLEAVRTLIAARLQTLRRLVSSSPQSPSRSCPPSHGSNGKPPCR